MSFGTQRINEKFVIPNIVITEPLVYTSKQLEARRPCDLQRRVTLRGGWDVTSQGRRPPEVGQENTSKIDYVARSVI
ncbi:unnamed protein product [Colias eurytheme]|nr:unnamed protein product [Colias eurytheme]